ncbi:MAG: acyltransferase [Bacteroidales bacterium]|nr:acyltransferase [Bacteroidales bacterium]
MKFKNSYRFKKAKFYTWLLKKDLGSIGKNSVIYPPFHSGNISEVNIGSDCSINAGSWIECIKKYGDVEYDDVRIDIGDSTYIGHRAHIIACSNIQIGKNVVFADGVYVTDNLHGFKDIHKPVFAQPLVCPGTVIIEDEVWLGESVCVLPNVTIGKHSVIGSNSVVTKSIPAYSIAVGSPAKVIKSYNFDTQQWEQV